jgi:hypothetical protein
VTRPVAATRGAIEQKNLAPDALLPLSLGRDHPMITAHHHHHSD